MANLVTKSGGLWRNSGGSLANDSAGCANCDCGPGVCNCSSASGSPSLTVTISASNCPCESEDPCTNPGGNIQSKMMTAGVGGTYTLPLSASISNACRWDGSFATGAAGFYASPTGVCTGSSFDNGSGIFISVLATTDPSEIASFIGSHYGAFTPPLAAGEWAWIALLAGFNSGDSPRAGLKYFSAITRISGCPSGASLGPMASIGYQGGGSFPDSLTIVPCGHLTLGQFDCNNECVVGECDGPFLTVSSAIVTL